MNIDTYSRRSLDTRIAAARESSGSQMGRCRRVLLPPGSWTLGEKALVFAGARGLVLEGSGPDVTELVVNVAGPRGIVLMDCIRSGLANLTVRAAARCGSLVQMGRWVTREQQKADGWPTMTQAILDNVVLDCGAYMDGATQTAYASAGIELNGPVNQNNDCHTFRQVGIHSYRTAGIYIVGNQSKGHLFEKLELNGSGIGKAGIWSKGGGWRAVACNSAGHSMADVVLEDTGDSVTMVGWHGETSRRFIDQPNRTGVPMAITLEGCEWMADQLAPDGNAIRVCGPGPLTVIGGHYGSGVQAIPHFYMAPFDKEPCSLTCLGATFGAFGAAQAILPPFRLPTLALRNIQGNLYGDVQEGRRGMALARPDWDRTGWGP